MVVCIEIYGWKLMKGTCGISLEFHSGFLPFHCTSHCYTELIHYLAFISDEIMNFWSDWKESLHLYLLYIYWCGYNAATASYIYIHTYINQSAAFSDEEWKRMVENPINECILFEKIMILIAFQIRWWLSCSSLILH